MFRRGIFKINQKNNFQIFSKSFQIFRYFSINIENENIENKNWNWVPPRQTITEEKKDNILEIIEGKEFTPEEISSALEKLNGIDVSIVKINGFLQGITHFVICSGESTRHLQTISDTLVKAVRDRKLVRAPSFKLGAEGPASTNWMIVDLGSIAVHIMMPKTRKRFNLEAHWTTEERPVAVYPSGYNKKKAEEIYQDRLEEICNKYPPPRDEDDDEAYVYGIGEEECYAEDGNNDTDDHQDSDIEQNESHKGKKKNSEQSIEFQGKFKGDRIRVNPLHSSGFIFAEPPKEYTKNKE